MKQAHCITAIEKVQTRVNGNVYRYVFMNPHSTIISNKKNYLPQYDLHNYIHDIMFPICR